MSTAEIQILDACEERFNLLTGSNRGYHHTFKKITRARMTPFQEGDIPAVNFYSAMDELVSKGAGFELRKLTVTIEAHALTRDRPFMDVAAELAADCITALYRSPDAPKATDRPSPKLGDLVDGIAVTEKEFLIREGQTPWSAARVSVEISYKAQLGQIVLWAG